MQIDITREPPVDIFQDRGKYIRISAAMLGLVLCSLLVGVYAFVADTRYSERLETVALVLFVGPGLLFAYFVEKLQAYKRLTPQQARELAELSRTHGEIGTYCTLVAKTGRLPILAEFEACQSRTEELGQKTTEGQG